MLVLGLSLLIGVGGYLLGASWTLWRVRRKPRDIVDVLSTATFVAWVGGTALALDAYGSIAQQVTGVMAAAAGYGVAYAAFHAVENADARR
jgi:hypothetical protein